MSDLVRQVKQLDKLTTLDETGLQLSDVADRDQWRAVGEGLRRLGEGYQWWIGDWLAVGEKRYGSTYTEAVEVTGLDQSALKAYKSVADRVPKVTRVTFLSWSHHREVADLAEEDQREWLQQAVDNGWSVAQFRSQLRAAQLTDTSDPPPLPQGTFRVIEADPPWEVPSGPKGPGHHYKLMDTPAICDLRENIHDLAAEDCHLYLWATNTLLPDAVRVMEAWGFRHRTVLTWVKPGIGLGHHFRTTTEHVLFGTRGKLDTLVNDQPTHFELPAGRHSAKPAEFYDIVERCSPGPYVRLFARDQRDGWESWGAEA